MADAQTTLGEAIARFLTGQSGQKSSELQPEAQKFLRWCGRDRRMAELTPRQIEAYCEATRADSVSRLAPLKAFLQFSHREGLTQENLALHAKARRRAPAFKGAKAAAAPAAKPAPDGYRQAQAEVEELKGQRVHVAEEIQRAAADKDFRENAPLDAAREKQGHLEARIRELEHILRYADVTQDGEHGHADAQRVRLGNRVVVFDVAGNEELTYMLVGPRETDPRQGKISVESPVGKAFLDRTAGEIVSVQAPAGVLRYRIERIES
jgi:transcription elongation factor GreA